MISFTPEGRMCSFCGRVGTKSTRFAGGYGALMCSDCVATYAEIFSTEQQADDIRRPVWEEMSKEELLEQLRVISATADQVQEFFFGWMNLIRARRASWAEIGAALGVSRQAAWERFARSQSNTKARGSKTDGAAAS